MPGFKNGPEVTVVILATGVKYCRYGLPPAGCCKDPAPVWNAPDPRFGRQTPTSSSLPHSPKLGVHGNPLLQLVVPVICHPPTSKSSSRPAFPANGFPLPNGSS